MHGQDQPGGRAGRIDDWPDRNTQEEAIHPQVTAVDGEQLNAMNDPVIRMSAEDLPPAGGFWSLKPYGPEKGFFFPNRSKKYIVGANAGMELNAEGGIEIYIAAERPEAVPEENRLSIEGTDLEPSPQLRICVPDLGAMKTRAALKAGKI